MALAALTACGGEIVTVEPTTEIQPTRTPSTALEPAPGPTSTATFAPPASTATPTVTPTPIVHVVQEGDTLGAIAFQYGVSVEAIQAANGIENPQFLRISQELIIPTGGDADNAAASLLLPTPTPLPLVAQGVTFYETPVGSLWCLGEVVNTTDSTLMNVQVYLALFDAAGERLIEASAFTAADVIPPGERSPFGILFTSPPLGWVNFQIAVTRGEAAGVLAASYVPMTATEIVGQASDPYFQVSGVVQNTSPDQAADNILVTVTTYDAAGLVTGFRQGKVELASPLAPGATAPFSVQLTFHGVTPADLSVIAHGRIPQ
jgi:LysM repeat protein